MDEFDKFVELRINALNTMNKRLDELIESLAAEIKESLEIQIKENVYTINKFRLIREMNMVKLKKFCSMSSTG